MFKFFDMISRFIETIVNAVVGAIKIVIYLFDLLGSGIAYSIACAAYMPPFLSGFCVVVFTLALVWTLYVLIRG